MRKFLLCSGPLLCGNSRVLPIPEKKTAKGEETDMRFIKRLILCTILVMLCLISSQCFAETKSFSSVKAAIEYVNTNQPAELTLEKNKFKPTDLLKIKNAMPEKSVFHFTTAWGKVTFSDDVEELDLKPKDAGVTIDELRAIVRLCPNLKSVDNSNKANPSNKDMIPLIEEYPDIHFDWKINLGKGHYVSSKATVYSTMNRIGSGKELNSSNLELLKYCPNLKALDIGHNNVTTLDFLQYVPDLELLIIADNEVTDITPIGQLKHLKYAELFKNSFSDLSALANCTELLDLNITWCPVTDLSPLDDIQTLERFWANMMRKLPEEQIGRFREKHPNTESYFYPSHAATVDGWRDHPRYKHYIWCFKNHQWIPFDEPLPTKK